ncbi:hypothetical protein LQW54_006599 [Pestalotiopsis sp. IQ-011]
MEFNINKILQGIYCDELFLSTKPTITLDETPSAGTSWHDEFAMIKWEDISPWDDFSEKTIDLLFDAELRTPLGNWTVGDKTMHAVNLAEDKEYEVETENDIDRIFRCCLQNPLLKTINFYGNVTRRKMGKSSKRHHVFDPEKLSERSKYDGAKIENTMGQMGMYAYWGKTSYAYVTTSKTLTVFRFFLISKEDNDDIRMGAESKSFSWDNNWKMVPKPIWALATLSMKDDEREVVTRQQMLPISTWRSRALPHPNKHEGESDKEQLSKKQEHDAHDSLRSVKGGRIKKPSGKLGTKKTETVGNAGLFDPTSSKFGAQ